MKPAQNTKIGIIGMGYVGLPLAVEFSQYFDVLGFDINGERIAELELGQDTTREVSPKILLKRDRLTLSQSMTDLLACNVFIITVPTPIDEFKNPNLDPLLTASKSVAEVLKKGDVVIYESTVYPGATEDDCVPILEKISGLILNKDFYVGYSPERINPGDNEHKISDIVKVTSGSCPEAANFIDDLYKIIITAGTYKAANIKEAEAAKVIENTQRDLNIALINELAIIFDKMEIDTEGVLKAAGTKWNFLPFSPGLVGGHCIGVDPYYLTYKAESIGYRPEIILSGRRLNDDMSNYVVSKLEKEMSRRVMPLKESKILIMGISFKENCPDMRNSKVIDIVKKLKVKGCEVTVYDPWVSSDDAMTEYGIQIADSLEKETFDVILLAVGHSIFKDMGIKKIREFGKDNNILFDLKYLFDNDQADLRL